MKYIWKNEEPSPEKRSRAEFLKRARGLPLIKRIDISLLIFVVILAGAWAAAAVVLHFLPPSKAANVRPIPDERILTNIRNGLPDQPFSDAVLHQNEIWMSRKNGLLHRFDPKTRLWSDMQPFAPSDLADLNFIQLLSGCGTGGNAGQSGQCPDPDALWAINKNGGLVRNKNGEWQIVAGDFAFTDADGVPVEADDLTAAAISKDKKWLVLGTDGHGIGIYSTQTRQWIPHDLPRFSAARIVFWKNLFWIGGTKRLAAVQPGRHPKMIREIEISGELLDLDAEPKGALWVLTRRECETGGNGCRRLIKLATPDGEPFVEMDERNLYPDLALSNFHFACQKKDRLYLAGNAGIYAYDAAVRSWSSLYDSPVARKLIMPLAGGDGFYFGNSGGVGRVKDALVHWMQFPNQPPVKLLNGAGDEALVLTDDGSLFSCGDAKIPRPVFHAEHTNLDPSRFSRAVAFGNTILFRGDQGAMVHSIAHRTYKNIGGPLPAPFTEKNRQWIASGAHLFAASPDGTVQAFQTGKIAEGKLQPEIPAESFPGPVKNLRDWNGRGLALIAGDGRVYKCNPEAVPMTGPPARLPDDPLFFDAAAPGGDLFLAGADSLLHYDGERRTLHEVDSSLIPGKIRDICAFKDRLLMVDDRGRLLKYDKKSPVLIGDDTGFLIRDDELNDALYAPPLLYLAGKGRVEAYDADKRRITGRWQTDGNQSAELKGVVNGLPLFLGGGNAFIGKTAFDPKAGTVIDLFLGSTDIFTVRETGRRRYLKMYPIETQESSSSPEPPSKPRCFFKQLFPEKEKTAAAIPRERPVRTTDRPARCFFRNPVLDESVTRVTDALELPSGVIATATNAGLYFYAPSARSWFRGPAGLMPQGGRMAVSGDVLVIESPSENGVQLTFAPISSIKMPDSCSDLPAAMEMQHLTVRAAAVDESAHRIAWIEEDGRVVEMQDGHQTEILAASKLPVDPAAFRRGFARLTASPKALLFTTDENIWKYDLSTQKWTGIAVEIAEDQTIDSISLENDFSPLTQNSKEPGETVVVKTTGGDLYTGTIPPDDSRAAMKRIYTCPSTFFDADADALTDVRDAGNGIWAFLLKDRIKFFDAKDRKWQPDLGFDNTGSPMKFYEAGGRMIGIGSNGQTWWAAKESGSASRASSRHDLSPPVLDAGQIQRYFRSQNHLLLETAGGLRAYDLDSGQERKLPESAAGIADIRMVREFGGNLWIIGSRKLLILNPLFREAGMLSGIKAVIADHDGHPWALTDDGWKRWSGNGFEDPRNGPGQSDIRIFAVEGAGVIGVESDGILHQWENGFTSTGVRLPSQTRTGIISGIARDDGKAWWMLSGSQLIRLEEPGMWGRFMQWVRTNFSVQPSETELVTDVRLEAPVSGAIVRVDKDGDKQWRMRLASGAGFSITKSLMGYQVEPLNEPAPPAANQLADQWPDFKKRALRLADGVRVFDPLMRFSTDELGLPVLAESFARLLVGADSAQVLKNPPPLNAGWLAWDRERDGFLVNNGENRLFIPKHQFIRNGQTIFEPVVALQSRKGRLFTATPYGIFTHNRPDIGLADIGLNNASVIFQPFEFHGPVHEAHGYFYTDREWAAPVREDENTPSPVHEIAFGDVRITEDIRKRTVSGTVTIRGNALPLFTEDGFIWDAGRKAIAYDPNGLILQTRAGIHSIYAFAGFDPGPEGVGAEKIRLFSDPDGDLILTQGAKRFRRGKSGWVPETEIPSKLRTAVSNGIWKWTLDGETLEVTLADDPHRFTFGRQADGRFGFSGDRLTAAAFHRGRLHVMTDAFFEIAGTPGSLSNFKAGRLPPQAADALTSIRIPTGESGLFRIHQGAITRWDTDSQRFTPVDRSENPFQKQILAETDRLRFTRLTGHVSKSVRVENPASASEWAEFNFINGAFPFDRVLSVTALDNRLFVGTAAGLQVYTDIAATGLKEMTHFISMGRTPDGAPVSEMKIFADAPDVLNIRFGDTCMQWRKDGPLTPCSPENAGRNRHELLAETQFWRWTRNAEGRVSGRYKDQNGNAAAEVRLSSGRFPHDRIKDLSVWNRQAFTLWESGWLTVHSDDSISLNSVIRNINLESIGPKQLVPVENEMVLDQASIPRSLYIETEDGAFWRLTGASQVKITHPPLIAGLKEMIDNPPVYCRGRLRLVQKPDDFMFEYLTPDNQWLPLPWQNGALAIDHWQNVVSADGRLYAATPAGLTSFSRDRSGRVMLDPNTFEIIPGPLEMPLERLTDMNAQNGTILLRFDESSEKVFSLSIGSAPHIFEKIQGADPFAQKILISEKESGFWQWELKDRRNGSPGYLTASFRGEPLRFHGGRFPFDSVNSLACLNPGSIETATDDGGWYRMDSRDFHLKNLKRPEASGTNPSEITRIGITCTPDGPGLRLQKKSSAEAFEECLGDDGFWRYLKTEDGLKIITRDRSGRPVERRLIAGRFTDDVVTGLPTAGKDEKGVFYLIPTQSGILKLNETLEFTALYKPPFNDLPGDAPRPILPLAGHEKPAHAHEDILRRIQDRFSDPSGLITAIPWRDRLFIIGREDVWEIENDIFNQEDQK